MAPLLRVCCLQKASPKSSPGIDRCSVFPGRQNRVTTIFSGKKNSCEFGFQGPKKKDGIRELSIDEALLKSWEPWDAALLPGPLKPMTRHTHSW